MAPFPLRKATGELCMKGVRSRAGRPLPPGSRWIGSAVAKTLKPNLLVRDRKTGCGLSALLPRMEVMVLFWSGSYEPGPGVACSRGRKRAMFL